ncbi:MAG: hypothetical protein K0Q90_4126 [Paenibacillaceae bacterium]|jgi:hypothetical protein|nr:hypothetical protein [Paenibacillaceae bacterium]
MAMSPIPTKVLQNLMNAIKLNITEEQLEKGYGLFRQSDSVEWMQGPDDGLAATCKEGGGSFQVQLGSSSGNPISCDCGEGLCRHGLAVFLQLLRVAGRNPEMFLMECGTAVRQRARREALRETAASDQPTESPSLRPASQLSVEPLVPESLEGHQSREARRKLAKRKPTTAFPEPDDSAADWRDYFRERFGKVLVTPRPSSNLYSLGPEVTSFYYSVLEGMADESAAWPPTLRGLFVLHAQLYAMEAIDGYFNRLPFSFGHYYGLEKSVRELAQSLPEHMEEILSLVNMNEAYSIYSSILEEALSVLQQNTFKLIASHQDWSGLYQAIWSRLFSVGDLMARERAKLNSLLKLADNKSLESRLRSSLAFFDFLGGDDEAALAQLTADSSLTKKGYSPFLRELYRLEAWSRLLYWLQALTFHLKREPYFLEQNIFPLWLEAAEAQPDEPGWLLWIKQMLPLSRGVYITYLIDNGDARKVTHMLLTEGYPIYYIDREILKLLEKTDLRLVLPLYHQDAERYILEKNRQSYKQAVRLLKKLAGFYKKLKEQDRWQAYIVQLAERHSRLRAFQEELRKGKLIV